MNATTTSASTTAPTQTEATAVRTVYVVDDDASVRESLSSLLRSAGMRVTVFASAQDFLGHHDRQPFACAVFDVRMPGIDGLALQDRLVALGSDLPIVFITGHGELPLAVRAMRSGAIDFLSKPFSDTELLSAIELALSRVSATSHERLELAELRQRYDQLTTREKQIMSEIACGKLNKAIAFDLGITESTIKVHRHNVMHKMQLKSIAALTLAMQRLRTPEAGTRYAVRL